jgi:23S rRNA C2498 (ribose-2'-O)-methylase RlmM
MDQFVEKAAQTLARKFGTAKPQTLLIGLLDPSSRDSYYKKLASNLRGRTLQLFPPLAAPSAETQDATSPTLFCLVGQEGLFCGIDSPRHCNGFYPGGTKFIPQNTANTISRAGAKIAEALHYLRLHHPLPPAGAHWLELGASPGGMTAELLAKGYRVTAIDRAPLDPRLDYSADLTFVRSDAARFTPAASTRFDAILCDLNGEPRDSIEQVIRLAAQLVAGGLVIFTLKTTGATTLPHLQRLADSVTVLAATGGLQLLAQTHLTYNRHEFTLFFRKRETAEQPA